MPKKTQSDPQAIAESYDALFKAAREGDAQTVKNLLFIPDDMPESSSIYAKIKEFSIYICEYLGIYKKDRYTSLYVNKYNGNYESALLLAAINGHADVVELLLQHKNIEVNRQDAFGRSALMHAVTDGYTDVVELLLQHKDIKVNIMMPFDQSALMLAAKSNYANIVTLLLQHKDIKVNHQNSYGDSALMLAAKCGHTEVVRLLLQHKDIKVNQQNIHGYRALHDAVCYGANDIVQLLLNTKGIEITFSPNDKHKLFKQAQERCQPSIFIQLLEKAQCIYKLPKANIDELQNLINSSLTKPQNDSIKQRLLAIQHRLNTAVRVRERERELPLIGRVSNIWNKHSRHNPADNDGLNDRVVRIAFAMREIKDTQGHAINPG